MTVFYLIRHGETENNRIGEFVGGRSDFLELNAKGESQADFLGRYLRKEGKVFDKIFSSLATRAVNTCRIACSHLLEHNEIILSDHLVELSQGDWEGKPKKDVHTKEMLESLNSDSWNFKAPNGESQKDVELRMYSFVEQCAQEYLESEILIFTHGLSIKCLLRKILDSDPDMTHRIEIFNTGITKLSYQGGKWNIHYINYLPHLNQI